VTRALVRAALIATAAAALAGCGTGGISKGGDPSAGKALFISGCGSCHTMADAATQGTIGPNLDNAFAADRRQGFQDSTIQQVVRDQIELAVPPMPANIYRGDDAESVAAYVAECAAWTKSTPCVNASQPPPPPTSPPPPPPPPPPGTTTGTTTAPPPPPAGDAVHGKALYTSLGCIGCHSLDGAKGAGPTFKGLAGSQVKLTDGTTVTADDAYLLEAITDPDKQIVAGFAAGIMSSVIKPGQVSPGDAADLVALIKQQK
jgi:mono/diheme cytochrome c family protein